MLSQIILMAPAGGQSGNAYQSLVFIVLIIVVFYFFMIRPQMKRQKELKNFRETLKKGDKIITNGGIYGKIMDVKEQTLTVEIADNVLVKVDKSAVIKDPADITGQK
jgi:preprotein translocase subunit YajC